MNLKVQARKKNLYIDGQWQEATEQASLTSPYSGDVIAYIPKANDKEVNEAIEAAVRAKTVMAKMPAHERSAILERLVALLEKRLDEAAEIIA